MAESCSNFLNLDISSDIFLDISSDISISKLLSYINLFNSYLDKININNNYCNIKNLIINFNKKTDKDIDKDIDKFVNPIVKNINTIISYYTQFHKNVLESNSMVHYYFIYAIYKSIIILFTYYYYLDNIYTYLSIKTINFKDITNDDEPQDLGKEDTILLTNFIKYILISVYNTRADNKIINIEEIEELNTLKDTCISFNSVTDDQIEHIEQCDIVFILQNIYKDICVKFNAIILGIDEKNIKFSYIKKRIDFILKKKDDKYNVIRKLIITINDLEIKNGISLGGNDYITIPQYTTVCWYISILTGMCYSDNSKKLLLNRINESNYNTNYINDKFINIIKYIIENITNDHKRYSDNITDNCDFFVYFKNNLLDFLLEKLNKLRETIHNELIYAPTNKDKQIIFENNFTDVFVNNDYYFIYLLLNYINAKKDGNYNTMLSQEITISDLIKTNKSLGINTYGYLILNTLYNIFNVNTLFIYHISDKYKKFKNHKNHVDNPADNPADNPDIIFIQEIDSSEETISDNISSSSNVENIPDITYTNNKDNIIYNGNNYKLDYILYNTINTETCDITTGCGHCISCIHYDNIKYYHDSRYPLHEIICNNDINIRIPCSLIRQDWNNNTNTYFTTDKCFTRDADISSDAFNIEKKIMVSEQYIFSNKTNLIRVYVKDVKDVKGGGNNKYKSMHKKINIMNDKKIIERTIYIDNNKNKFIKINKQYENLSNFKYNKKNKFYYKK